MNHRKLQEELSAYLDGEAADPAAIRQMIREDPEAARLYRQMTDLSNRLDALPEPDVPAQFLTRVLADVNGTHASHVPRARGIWRAATAVTAMAAAVTVVLSVAFYRAAPGRGVSEEPPTRAASGRAFQGADAWLTANQAILDSEWERTANPDDFTVASADLWLSALAEEEWFPSFAWSVESRSDIDSLLGSLTDSESETLKRMLLEYAEEELST